MLVALSHIPTAKFQAISAALFPRVCAWALIASGDPVPVGLGIAVLVLPLRHPVVFAKQAASIDVASGGRDGVRRGKRPPTWGGPPSFFSTEMARTAIGIDALTVSPARSPRYTVDAPKSRPNSTPRMMALAVNSAGDSLAAQEAVLDKPILVSEWSYRAADWAASDRGRRLDHIWVSRALKDKVADFRILRDARGWERPSDHVPVTAVLDV